MGRLILVSCLALLGAAAAATSAPAPLAKQIAPSDAQQAASPSGGKAVQAPEEKIICKQLPSTGSRLPNRACLTEREWKQLEADLQQ